MTTTPIKALHILTVRYGKNGVTRCAMNYITHLPHTRADLACGFPLPAGVEEDFSGRGARAVSLPARLRRPLGYMRALTELIRTERYDLVQVHGNSCTMALELLAAKRGGAPVRIPHAHNTRCSARLLHRLLRPVFERCRTGAFACGKDAGDFLYRGRPFTVVKNAVDTKEFAFDEAARDRARAALSLEGRFVLGHVGGFNAQKNHAALLDIFEALRRLRPDAALLLAGDGPLRETVERAAAERGLSGDLRIVRATDEVSALYAAMDVFILPSLFEGLPFTLIEAQAGGLGCLASDTVTREADMSGLVRYLPLSAPPEDWAAAILKAETLRRAEESRKSAARIAENGYSISDEAATLEALYEKLVSEARR